MDPLDNMDRLNDSEMTLHLANSTRNVHIVLGKDLDFFTEKALCETDAT